MFTFIQKLTTKWKKVPTAETFNTSEGTESQTKFPSSDELTTQLPIANTPFWIQGNKEWGYCITVGRHVVTPPMKTVRHCKEFLEYNKWNVICALIQVLPRAEDDLRMHRALKK